MKEDIIYSFIRPVKMIVSALKFSERERNSSIIAVSSQNYMGSENVLEIAPDVSRRAAIRLSISMHV